MRKSPGHQKWPEHRIQEISIGQRVTVDVDGELLADSTHVVRVDEDHHPTRYYFPRSDVRMELLERAETTTKCPFKGTAHYFNVRIGGKKISDAVWTYEEPYDEHQGLRGRVAFYDDRIPEIQIHIAGDRRANYEAG